MSLTNAQVKSLKAKDRLYKISDEKGLVLEITSKGSKRWRLRYRFGGKEKLLSLGIYPDVSLKEARRKRDELRGQLAEGRDPSALRKAQKNNQGSLNSFEIIGREWLERQKKVWSNKTAIRNTNLLINRVFPYIGSLSIEQIKPKDLLAVLRRIEEQGFIESAHRARQLSGQIFRYAIAIDKAEFDISASLRGALQPVVTKHHPTITNPKEIGALLRTIDGYTGSFQVKSALQLAPLVFVRSGELRQAEWSEFDFDKAEWRIPADKMKIPTPHIVPLSKQAIAILKELHLLNGTQRYLFSSLRSSSRPMSNNTVNAALRRLGYSKEEMTGHGFRSMASTILNEQGWNRDAIERQLAHQERNSIRAAYNYTEYLPERKKMMQAWADYLDKLKGS